MTYLISVCSRSKNTPNSLRHLKNWVAADSEFKLIVNLDSPSIYEGHSSIHNQNLDDTDTVILCHDDVQIISSHSDVKKHLETCYKKNAGVIGLAGATMFDNGAWWTARKIGATRGFVFQGKEQTKMAPNYFGQYGKVIVLDGLFLAMRYGIFKKFKFEKPHYLSSNWDYYDISYTWNIYNSGYDNYAVPIVVMHESPGEMRKEWYIARDQFLKYWERKIPAFIAKENE